MANHPPDRDLPPGLRFPALDMERCRQLVGHTAQSTAVHSRSRGWLPMVKLDITSKPLRGPGPETTLELIIRPDDLRELRRVLDWAMMRAVQDAELGIVDDLPEPPS